MIVVPYSLKDAPALIERLLPVQKLSIESFFEQMAGQGKFLVSLGGYWKGRKPLILAKACVLGCLLPATENPEFDLKIFEKLLAMDDESFVVRWKNRPTIKDILGTLTIPDILEYFTIHPEGILPRSAPVDWSKYEIEKIKIGWRIDISETKRRNIEARLLPKIPYRERVAQAIKRPEEVGDFVHDHIWDDVNSHIGTNAHSFSELIEQLGIMRFGHRPKVADTFCGSGQIAFEAARLGCDVYASDLNPVACMLTWGAFNIIGGSTECREKLSQDQKKLVHSIQTEIDNLGVELDGKGWRAKAFLYCLEARCPQSGWRVPLLSTRVVSISGKVIVELIPDPKNKCYDIVVLANVSDEKLVEATNGTIGRDSRFGEGYLIHKIDGITYKTKISTLRGDFEKPDGTSGNLLRLWEKEDFKPRLDDIFQERLYCIQWVRPKNKGKLDDYEFRAVTNEDIVRERVVEDYLEKNLIDWQKKGWIPDMRIEPGGPPRYEGLSLIRGRGWTYWHHLFNPRQLLIAGLVNHIHEANLRFALTKLINQNAKLSRWDASGGGGGKTQAVFDNQALNTLYNYGCRSCDYSAHLLLQNYRHYVLKHNRQIGNHSAEKINIQNDIYITDPPYGDAVKYEEILDFFIAWLRKDPPQEFAGWIWDSRRSLAIKGEGEDFRHGMVAAYKQMTACMPDNGMQVIMFTHQGGPIWADMANIVWASGLQVTAAWYVVTETDSALREGSYVKGTVLLVCRKRQGIQKTTRDDLAWEIQEEVEKQVQELTGLNQKVKGFYRDENVFEDADIQMAGYAAALRVLTRYATIDGRDMTAEAIRPRVKGETTFVDGLISFAVDTANQCLVPHGIEKKYWDKLGGAERFYLKMLDMESRGAKRLDNYQNFAKAFKVRNFQALLASQKANDARLKSAIEFGKLEMNESSELFQSVLRAVLYSLMELIKNVDSNEVLAHLTLNIPNYYGDMTQRELVIDLSEYLAKHLDVLRPEEASAARVLCEMVKNQRLG